MHSLTLDAGTDADASGLATVSNRRIAGIASHDILRGNRVVPHFVDRWLLHSLLFELLCGHDWSSGPVLFFRFAHLLRPHLHSPCSDYVIVRSLLAELST